MDKLIPSEKAIGPLAWALSFGPSIKRAVAVGNLQSFGARLPFLLLRQALQSGSRGGIVRQGTQPLSWNSPNGFAWIERRDHYIHSQTSRGLAGESSTKAETDASFLPGNNPNFASLAPFLFSYQTSGQTTNPGQLSPSPPGRGVGERAFQTTPLPLRPLPLASSAVALTVINRSAIPAGIHVRLSCLSPLGLMQICSRQICAGIQTTGKYSRSPSMALDTRFPAGITSYLYNLIAGARGLNQNLINSTALGRTVPVFERQGQTGVQPCIGSSAAIASLQSVTQGKSHEAPSPLGNGQGEVGKSMAFIDISRGNYLFTGIEKITGIATGRQRAIGLSAMTNIMPTLIVTKREEAKTSLIKSFDRALLNFVEKLRTNGNVLTPFMVSSSAIFGRAVSNRERSQLVQRLPKVTKPSLALEEGGNEESQSGGMGIFTLGNRLVLTADLLARKPTGLPVLIESIANSLRGELASAIKRTGQQTKAQPDQPPVDANSVIRELEGDDRLARVLLQKMQNVIQEERFRSGQLR